MQIRILILLILISFPILTYSQDKENIDSTSTRTSLGFKINTGSIIPHQIPLRPLVKGIVKAFEVSFGFNTIDNKIWHNYFNHPEVGISYLFMDFGYKEVLGYSHSIYPFIEFPLIHHDKPLNLNIKLAMGLSYITKRYDSISNPINIAISSPINLYASLGLNLSYRLSSRVSANIGFSGSHFSNGSIKKPNYGLNILTGNFGLNYNLNKHTKIHKSITEFEIDNSRWLAIVSGGYKETGDPGGSMYGIGTITIEYSKSWKTLFRYGTSFDFMYDGSTFVHFREDSVKYKSRLKASKLGSALMIELNLYRLSAYANFGVYLYNHDKQISAIYQRIGLRYRITKSLYTQFSIKTHLNVADYVEVGIGYRLK